MRGIAASLLLGWCLYAFAAPVFEPWSHAVELSRSGPEEADYLLGLGALQKVGGRWRHKRSESLHGQLQRITWQLNEGSICGLGQTAALPLTSALKYFPREFRA